MKEKRISIGAVILIGLTLVLWTPIAGMAGPKIYWHFTVKAFVHMPDTSAVEWSWITMVEYGKPKAFPDETETARQFGGELQGTVFAFVRGAAWRSSHRYTLETRCHDRPSQKEIFWEESESDSVYAAGQLISSEPFRGVPGTVPAESDQFRFGFTNRKILRENGSWEDLKGQAQVFTGAIHVEGRMREETKGDFYLQVVNYRDNLEHHRRCEDAWVEQYLTAFRTFRLVENIPAVGQNIWGQQSFGPHDRNNFVWEVHRSTSPEHPHWKQQDM